MMEKLKIQAEALIPALEKELKDVFNVSAKLEPVVSHGFGIGYQVILWSPEESEQLHQLILNRRQEYLDTISPKIAEWSEGRLSLEQPKVPFKALVLVPV